MYYDFMWFDVIWYVGSYFTLNGSKMWITNGTIDGSDTGDVFLIYARTCNKSRDGLTSFIVEKGKCWLNR
jgi:alkylation response protein AidB-like acyl-CoA dehydrogenase